MLKIVGNHYIFLIFIAEVLILFSNFNYLVFGSEIAILKLS